MMGVVDEAPRSWWLLRGMARTARVDLARAVVDGWLTRDELARMVLRCAECGRAAACIDWLARPEVARPADFCQLRPMIEELAPEAG